MIPKPFETGMLWATLPERMIGYMYGNDEKELADAMLWMALETFNLNAVPQVFNPLVQLAKNKNFTGAPIVPQYLENVIPEEQYRFYTSDAMIALGRKLGISPLKAEHLVRGYFGTLGAWGLGLADYMVGDIAQGGADPTKDWEDNILLSPFVNDGPLRRTHSEEHLYDMLRSTREIADTVRTMSRRSPERIEGLMDEAEAQVLLSLNESLGGWAAEMRELKNAMDVIRSDPEMDGDAKREAIFQLERAQNEISRAVYTAINPEEVQRLIDDARAASRNIPPDDPDAQ